MNTIEIKLNETLGSYKPAFFDIYLNTNKSMSNLKFEDLSEKERSAFFHEYIHFLQDITTTCGLANIYVINESFKLVATQYASKDEFEIPVEIKNNVDNVKLNKYINTSSFGERKNYPYNNVIITDIRCADCATDLSKTSGIEHIPTIEFQSHGKWWKFGYKEIMESMAYILQRLCTHSFTAPEFPYMISEKIATYLCPDFSSNILNVLALCDVSLMTTQPGAYFVSYIQQIANNSLKISQPTDIYDYYYSLIGNNNGKMMNSTQHYIFLHNQARESLKSYIAIPCIKNKLDKWIDMIFDFSINIRLNNKYLFLELATQGNELLKNSVFKTIFHTIGSGFIHNNKGEYGRFPSHPNDYGDVMQYLLAVYPIYRTFFSGIKDKDGKDVQCYLQQFCDSSGIKTDSRCITPWLRVNDYRLCPVATIWKHRKLANISIKIK